jgi:hypothetical protein
MPPIDHEMFAKALKSVVKSSGDPAKAASTIMWGISGRAAAQFPRCNGLFTNKAIRPAQI